MGPYLTKISLLPINRFMKYFIFFAFLLSCSQWSPERNPAGSMVVQSLEQLKDRIERAEDGDIILIDKYAAFDLTYEKPIVISKKMKIGKK